MKIDIKKVDIKKVETEEEINKIYQLREQVFVGEQGVPLEIERDSADQKAIHIIAQYDNQSVGCGRIVFYQDTGKIGRLAVVKEYRGQGIGKALCSELINIATLKGYEQIILHAQLGSRGFYEKQGFQTSGDVFEEAGIKHIKMIYILKQE